jgi:hypothetical protein
MLFNRGVGMGGDAGQGEGNGGQKARYVVHGCFLLKRVMD